MHILLVEDDAVIASGLDYSLRGEGYRVTHAPSCRAALQALQENSYDFFILDITLPDGSGYDLCRKIKQGSDAPVLFLTACDDEVNIVMGLDMGADDYITKPFRLRELLSRIKSIWRRVNKTEDSGWVQLGGVQVNTKQAKVYKAGKEVLLTALEYRLLLTFLSHPGQALSRSQLLDGIWDVGGNFVNDNTLSVYIKRLREKLEEDPQEPRLIQTVRGLGYRMGGQDEK